MTKTTAQPEVTVTLEELDPGSLLLDANPRGEPRLSPEFVASIRDLGVLQPPIAHRDPAAVTVMVRMGKRRVLGAIEAGQRSIRVVVVTGPPGTEVDRLVEQIAENDHREPLTTGEYAAGVAALFDAGLSAAQVAKRLHRPTEHVEAAKAAAASPAALAAAASYGLDLIQAAALAAIEAIDAELAAQALAEIEDEPEQTDHVLSAFRQQAAERAIVAAFAAGLAEQGITVLDSRPSSGFLTLLKGADGGEMTDAEHATCPGHAAWVTSTWRAGDGNSDYELVPVAHFVCADWQGNGHEPLYAGRPHQPASPSAGDDSAAAAATQERRRVRANNTAWRAALDVRRDFLRKLAARKSPPDGGLAFLLESAVRHGGWVFKADTMGSDPLGWSLIGAADRDGAAKLLAAASGPRGQMLVLTLALGGYEDYISADYRTWRSPDAGYESGGVKVASRYLRQLETWGYTLAPIEQATADGNTRIDLSTPKGGAG